MGGAREELLLSARPTFLGGRGQAAGPPPPRPTVLLLEAGVPVPREACLGLQLSCGPECEGPQETVHEVKVSKPDCPPSSHLRWARLELPDTHLGLSCLSGCPTALLQLVYFGAVQNRVLLVSLVSFLPASPSSDSALLKSTLHLDSLRIEVT